MYTVIENYIPVYIGCFQLAQCHRSLSALGLFNCQPNSGCCGYHAYDPQPAPHLYCKNCPQLILTFQYLSSNKMQNKVPQIHHFHVKFNENKIIQKSIIKSTIILQYSRMTQIRWSVLIMTLLLTLGGKS